MHRLQQHILQELIRHSNRRYSELKPSAVEGNLFMYHLRQLIKLGYVTKSEGGEYKLTVAGQAYVDRYSLKLSATRLQPRIVTMVACQNEDGQWLWYRRHRQPMIGQVGFIYGNLHLGAAIVDEAARELTEKSGYQADLERRGDGYLYVYEGEEVISAIMFHLFVGTNPQKVGGKFVDAGEHFWAHLEDVPANELLPGTLDIIDLINNGERTRFWAELSYHL